MSLLTIVKREGGEYVRQGWVSVPFDATLHSSEGEKGENGFVALSAQNTPYISIYPWASPKKHWLLCERYGVRIVSCGSLAVAGMFDAEASHGRPNSFDQVMGRVTLALDGHVYWPDWDDTIMEPVHEGTLVHLEVPSPIDCGGEMQNVSPGIVYIDEASERPRLFDDNPKLSKSSKRSPGGTGNSPAASMTGAMLKKLGLARKRDTV